MLAAAVATEATAGVPCDGAGGRAPGQACGLHCLPLPTGTPRGWRGWLRALSFMASTNPNGAKSGSGERAIKVGDGDVVGVLVVVGGSVLV